MHNIVTVWKSGGEYSEDYVWNLRRGVARHLDAPHRFIVLTDTVTAPVVRDDIDYEPLLHDFPKWHAKAEIFRSDLGQKYGRLFYIDLSTLIVGDLSELASYDGPACVGRDWYYDFPSQYMLNFAPGSLDVIWHEFTKDPDYWIERGNKMEPPEFRDQALMSIRKPDHYFQDLWPGQIVSFKKHCTPYVPEGARVIKFHGKPRIHECGGWVKTIWEGGGEPQWESRLNHDPVEMLRQIETNVAAGWKWWEPRPPHKGKLVICGGGPSLADNLDKIRFRKRRGQTIWALNGVHDYLIENRIIPDAMVMTDSRPADVCFVQKPRKDVKYYIAANCHPDVFAALKGYDVEMWFLNMDETKRVYEPLMNGDRPFHALNGGNTVGLRSMTLGFWNGYRDFTLFGYDSSYRNGDNHAYRQPLNDGEAVELVYAGDTPFYAARWMIVQTNVFQKTAKELVEQWGCSINVIGDGLLPFVAQRIMGKDKHVV